MIRRCRNAFAYVSALGVTESDDDTTRLQKMTFTGVCVLGCLLVPIWGSVYVFYDEVVAGAIPLGYAVVSSLSLVVLRKNGNWSLFRKSQLSLIFVLPFALMVSLGGFVPGSAVVIWATMAPLGALWSGTVKEATVWLGAFVAGVVLCGLATPYLRHSNNLPSAFVTIFFVMNIVAVTTQVFYFLAYFVGRKDEVIDVMRRNRELEEAYLQQEITLRQSERLATLGKLSAGVAHELNNPASAAQRAAAQLQDTMMADAHTNNEVACLELSPSELEAFEPHMSGVANKTRSPQFLDPLVRSDREGAMETYLDAAGHHEAWVVAPALVGLGYEPKDLEELSAVLDRDKFAPALSALAGRYTTQSLLREVGEGTGRILEIVKALSSYSHLDRAPRQAVDLHEGLDDTLVMLQSRLKSGIEVRREYASDLPRIDVYGSELNQVWTNIIDNAIDAMDGQGGLVIQTKRDGDDAVVQITDSGPGIPPKILNAVFDPFVTTKPPGSGTGLGLNISHNIVQKHHGEIRVESQPGETRFTVRLPIDQHPSAAPSPSQGRSA